MNLGTLTIEMAANVARLQRDMEHAKRTVDGAMKQIRSAASAATKALGALGIGLTAGALAAWVKGSINAADETAKLAQKIGVATNQVAGLQMAFQLSGLEAGALQKNMGRLASEVAKGNTALAALGISSTDANGNLKSTRQVLGEVADKFAGYEDGLRKTALAAEIFGERAGAEMIPLLNGGAKALDEFDAMAKRLGLTIEEDTAKKAEQFNDTLDLISMSGQGVARQIAAQLLPTLTSLAGSFFDSMTQGDGLRKVADALAAGLKILYSVGVGVVQTFSAVGKTLGAAVGQVVALLRGDFSGAMAIGREWAEDMRADWTGAAQSIASAWDTSGNSAVASMAATVGAMKKAAPDIAAFEAARKKAADDAKRDAAEAQKAAKAWADEQSRRAIEALNAYEAEEAAADERLKTAKDLLDSIEHETKLLGVSNEEREVAIALRQLEAKGIKEGTEAYNEYADAIRRAIVDRETVRKSIEQSEQIKKDWEQKAQQIGQSLSDALMEGGRSAWEYIKGLFRSEVLRPIIQAVVAPITGALGLGAPGSAMASGGASSFGSISSLANAASFIKKGMSGITSAFATGPGSLMGNIGLAINNLGNSIGSTMVSEFGAGMYGGATQAGGAMGAGGMAGTAGAYGLGLVAGHYVGRAISGGYGRNTTVNAGMIIGSVLGGPIGGAIGGAIGGVLNRAFGRKAPEVQQQGIEGTFGGTGFTGNTFADMIREGGWFRSDKRWTDRGALDPTMQAALSGTFAGLKGSIIELAEALGAPVDQIESYSKTLRLAFGSDEAANQKLIDDTFARLGEEMARLVLGVGTSDAPAIGGGSGIFGAIVERLVGAVQTWGSATGAVPFAREGETALQTLQRLGDSLVTVNRAVSLLGRTLFEASFASGDLASKIVDAFGGADGFTAATAAYFDAIYSESEKLASAQAQLQRAFDALGLAVPANAAAYRALVEAQDLATDAGIATYSALVQLAPAFAQVTDALDTQAQAAEDAARAVRDAWGDIGSTIADEIRRIRGVATGGAGGYAMVAAQFATATARARAGDQEAARMLPGLSADLLAAAEGQARTTAEFAVIRGQVAGSLEQTMAIAARMFDSQAIVDELKALREEVALLRAETQATASHTSKTARILDRVTQQGDSLLITDSATI